MDSCPACTRGRVTHVETRTHEAQFHENFWEGYGYLPGSCGRVRADRARSFTGRRERVVVAARGSFGDHPLDARPPAPRVIPPPASASCSRAPARRPHARPHHRSSPLHLVTARRHVQHARNRRSHHDFRLRPPHPRRERLGLPRPRARRPRADTVRRYVARFLSVPRVQNGARCAALASRASLRQSRPHRMPCPVLAIANLRIQFHPLRASQSVPRWPTTSSSARAKTPKRPPPSCAAPPCKARP